MVELHRILTIARTGAGHWVRNLYVQEEIGMNRLTVLVVVAMLGVALSLGYAANQAKDNQAEVALQAAIKREVVDGDLKAAIELYRKLAQSSNRAVAAQALLRMGQCYERQGDAEARKAYERLVKEYGDQKEAVVAAQARLAALGGTGSGVTYRQVWSGPKVDDEGMISPDGRYMSFVDWNTGDLALHDFATNTDRRLTNKGKWGQSREVAAESAISRDGKQVAYSWRSEKTDRYEVRVVSLQSSGFPEPRRLFDSEDVTYVAPYDWSSDGRWLAVALRRKGTVQLGLISTQDGSLRVLRSAEGGPRKMFFSPDGKYLGADFSAGGNLDRDVFVLAVDGSGETKAVVNPGQDFMMGWSPDGKRLLFASDRTGSLGLWAVPIVDGKPQGVPELIRPDVTPWSLGVTSSGALYVGARLSTEDIRVASLDFNTGKVLAAPVGLVQSFIGVNWHPDWSPDGKSLAYVSARDRMGGNRVLAIRSLETGQVRELRPKLREFWYPRWAPDGRSFVVQGADSQGRQGIYRIDAETGEAAPIAMSTPEVRFQMPQWWPDGKSPDGRRIYYRGQGALIERDLASGTERELIRRSGLTAPGVSPDGRYVVTRSSDPSTKSSAVLLIPTAGGEPRELLRAESPQLFWVSFSWVPDGRAVIVRKFLSESGDQSEYWLVPIGGGQPRKLDIDPRAAVAAPIRVHPDGRQIAYVAGEAKIEVWVLENFLPGAKAASK